MPRAATCPELSQYRRLTSGQMSDAAREGLLEHLQGCDACATRLNALPEQDTLVGLIRQGQTLGGDDSREIVERLVERLSKLRPGDNPAGAGPNLPPAAPAPLTFSCPACGKTLKVKGEMAGKRGKCPHCKQVVVAAKSAAAPERAPASGVSIAAVRTTTHVPARHENTMDQPSADAVDQGLYDFLAPPQAADELGRLGPYRVLRVLGAGGMGVVFRAEDPQLARLVALKAMLPSLAAGANARQRFLREARAAAAIKHDHIVTIYQVGEDRGVPFLAMDFLEGEPLDARLERQGRLPVAEVLRIGREMALGLAAAHQRGLIHRDIKPANVWLETPGGPGASATGGRVKILDFGLARAVGDDAHLTQSGAILGTPAYMAPEQARGKSVDHRCDLFSLGCVLYHLATGERPFRGTDTISMLMAVATENPTSPVSLNLELPTELSDFIMQLLAKEPKERPESAQAVVETLERMATVGVAIRAAVSIPLARLESPALQAVPLRRKKWPILAGVAACLLLGLAGLWAAGVFKLKTQEGTIVVENLPADAEVFVDGEKVALKLKGDDKPIEIQVAPGKRKLEIKAAGFKMETREVTLASGERSQPIDIRLEPLAVAPDKPALPGEVPSVRPSAALEALRRDQIAPEALALAGDGDPNKAPASLVAVLGEAQPFHSQAVLGLAYSPDGRWLASGSADKTIMLRDTVTGRVTRILQGHTGAVSAVGFSKDSRTLVSASHDGTLRLWSVDKDEKPTIVGAKLVPAGINGMAVSPDGRFVAVAGDSVNIKLWKWGEWEKPTVFPALTGKMHIQKLSFSPDGELLACGGWEEGEKRGRTVRIYATADGTPKGTMSMGTFADGSGVNGLSFSHDGKQIAAVGDNANGRVWEVSSGKTVTEFPTYALGECGNNCYSVAWSPDDKALAVGGHFRVGVFDLPSGTTRTVRWMFRQSDKGGIGIGTLAFSPGGDLLAAADSSNGEVPVWDTTNWKQKYLEHGHRHHMISVAVSPDGRELYSLGEFGDLLRWQLARPREPVVRNLDLGNDTRPRLDSVSASDDGKTYVITDIHSIVVRNTVTEKETVIPTDPQPGLYAPPSLSNPAVSADGRTVAAGGNDGFLKLWDIALGRDVHHFPIKGRWCGLAFSRDGKFLSSCNEETKRVTIWDVVKGTEGCSWDVKSVSRVSVFSPEGQIVATGHDDGSILLWDAATGQMKRALAGHSAPIRALKFTPDGKTLVSSGNDGVIRLWNPENVRAREVIPIGPANRSLTFDLDPSGKYLFAGGQSPVIFVLRIPPADGRASSEGTQAPAAGKEAVDAAWLKEVASLPAAQQVQAVAAKLKDLNPGFVGPVTPGIEGREVTSLAVPLVTVTDISPLRALPGLRTLDLGGGPLADLSPLKDMKLTWLKFPNSRVSDLSPLKDMKLKYLNCGNSQVSDLSPLKDMKLTYLNCVGTRVQDLSPLKGMPLTCLECEGTFSNLAALKGMPLTRLVCIGSQVSDLAPLRDMKLTELACLHSPVTDAGLMALQEMASLRQLEIVDTKTTDAGLEHLKKLTDLENLNLSANTKLSGAGLVHLKGMSGLQTLNLANTEVSDDGLVHLKGLLGLRELNLEHTWVTDAGLENLAGLKNLRQLNLGGTAVTDQGVAKLQAALPHCEIIADVKARALEPAATPAPLTVTDAWLKEVAALPAAQQVQAVAAKLKDLNPGFDSPLSPVIEGGVVKELRFGGPKVRDISPLRALPGLRTLMCAKAPLTDLSPLKGMKLTSFSCCYTPVYDLSPLKDMRLDSMDCAGTRVSDLTPLKGMKLTALICDNSQVTDLSPLKGMPLNFVSCGGTLVSDLSPLKDMKLTGLCCGWTRVSDLSPLKDMKLSELECQETSVSNLTPLKNMKLTRLCCQASQVTGADLAPLQEMSSLQILEIGGPKMTDAGLEHLQKLTYLEYVSIYNSKLAGAGLVHLKGMTRLQRLCLYNTQITDEGLVHLKDLLGLRDLDLRQTRITDAGLEHLAGLKDLVGLHLGLTAVTDKGVAKLKAALPNCNISRGGL